MKHKLVILLSFTMILVTFWGCATSSAPARSGSTEQTSSNEPDWWFNPASSKKDFLAFGQAKKQNPSLSQKVAQQRAAQDIASQVKILVTGIISDMMSESGLGKTAQAVEFSENATEGITKASLSGSTPDKYFKAKDGTVYVRVSYSKDAVDQAILNAAKKEEALYHEFKATQAFDKLQQRISGM